jgi:hypothetical protein
VISTKNLTLVAAPGAVLAFAQNGTNRDTLDVSGAVVVNVHGLDIRQGSASGGSSAVRVRGAGTGVTLTGCTVGPSSKRGVDSEVDTIVQLRRTRVHTNGLGGLALLGVWTVENSVIVGNGGASSPIGGASFAQAGDFEFNTVTGNIVTTGGAAALACTGTTTVSGSIVFGNTGGAGQLTAACNASTSLVAINPSFLGDGYHVGSRSVALDNAGAVCPAVDYDGEQRPMDAACDFGADERPIDPEVP